MTPREELIEDIDHTVEAYGQSRQETRRTLNKYAIGKWVPVSERLPEFDDGRWAGFLRNDDAVLFGRFHYKEMMPEYEWLELDIPEVEL